MTNPSKESRDSASPGKGTGRNLVWGAAFLAACFLGWAVGAISPKLSLIPPAAVLVLYARAGIAGGALYFPLILFLTLLPESGREVYPSFLSLGDLVAALIVVHWASFLFRRPRPEAALFPMVPAIAVLLAFGLSGAAVGAGRGAPLEAVISDFLQRSSYAALALVPLYLPLGSGTLRRLAALFLLCAAGVASLGILQTLLGFKALQGMALLLQPFGYHLYSEEFVMRYIWWSPEMVRKPFLPFFGPNSLAGLLLLAFPLGLASLRSRRPVLPPSLLACLLTVVFLCLMLTFSRTCQAALILTVLAGAFMRRRARGIGIPLAAAVVGLALVVPRTVLFLNGGDTAGVAGPDRHVTFRFLELKESNVSSRRVEYARAVRLLIERPLLGAGYSIAFAGGDLGPRDHDLAVSSVYLETAARTGLPGLAAFGAVWVVFFPLLLARTALPSKDSGLRFGFGLAVAGALTAGLFDHTFQSTPALNALFWLFAGFALSGVDGEHPHR